MQRDGHVAPAEMDIGMMAFGFGKLTDLVDEFHRPLEVRKAEGALDAVRAVDERPGWRLRKKLFRRGSLQRRSPAAAGNAGFLGEACGHLGNLSGNRLSCARRRRGMGQALTGRGAPPDGPSNSCSNSSSGRWFGSTPQK